jgi:hypothetical protein
MNNTLTLVCFAIAILITSYVNMSQTITIKDLHNRVKALEAVCKNLNIPIPKVEKD